MGTDVIILRGKNLVFWDQVTFTSYLKPKYVADYEWNKMASRRLNIQIISLHPSQKQFF